mmetsp:Transcript_11797/g.33880  ORF Transcript_11797/g.33880 Transcript_11797/m.33880 type:complete len:125 (+) Transcript_11797:70-444(+)
MDSDALDALRTKNYLVLIHDTSRTTVKKTIEHKQTLHHNRHTSRRDNVIHCLTAPLTHSLAVMTRRDSVVCFAVLLCHAMPCQYAMLGIVYKAAAAAVRAAAAVDPRTHEKEDAPDVDLASSSQ